MPPAHPHDAFGQSLLEDVAWTSGFLRGALDRDIVALLPDGPFAVFESGFVDSELRITRADGVFSIRLTDGRTLYTIIEHKSTADPDTPLQIAEYVLRVWRCHVRLEGRDPAPLIVPIVLYHGPAEWSVPRSIADSPGSPGDPLRYELLDLVRTPYEELAPDDRVRSGLAILKYALVEDPSHEHLREAVRTISLLDPELKPRLASYMVAAHQLTREDLESILREADPDLWETVMPTVAEEWKEEGRVEGLTRGRAEGKAETLLRQLERRFGAVPGDTRARILAAPVGELDAWLDAFVSASSLDDVFRNGAIH